MKFLVRARIFDIGDDFWVEDEQGQRAFWVDGKALRLRQTFELKTPDGQILFVIRKKLLSLRGTMEIERDGQTVATVRQRMFNLIKDRLDVDLAGGGAWDITGSFLDKEYSISDAEGPVAQISRKWFQLRDTYAVDVNTFRTDLGGDPALVVSVAVCVDALTGRSGER
ncbi:LURP-one-related/scramblase family protein [Nocardiopsis rhodophaea]|uniref:LURP-one-related/scramblase family protein n=1 Tax=Nocardiopsis rhodophaea TaxID=280238 RepID=A0ABN2SJU0_9ACTN